MGVKLSWADYRNVSRVLTRPASFVSVDRYVAKWEKEYLGDPIQFIHKYTDPGSLLVIIGERAIKSLLGL